MGTWGVGILQSDTVADVVGFVTDQLKSGNSIAASTEAAIAQFSELEDDQDDGPLVWLALAHMQWKYGTVEDRILRRVREDLASGNSLDSWRDDAKTLAKRLEVLTKFIDKISVPNSKPSAPPKRVIRKAPFKSGDCLSVLLEDGRYTAALVLKEDNSNPEYGRNLVASLDYLETSPPTLKVFESRKWLIKSHGNWKNEQEIHWSQAVRLREALKRITVVGNIQLRTNDPSDSNSYSGWSNLGVQVVLCRAHVAKNA